MIGGLKPQREKSGARQVRGSGEAVVSRANNRRSAAVDQALKVVQDYSAVRMNLAEKKAARIYQNRAEAAACDWGHHLPRLFCGRRVEQTGAGVQLVLVVRTSILELQRE